MIVTQIAACAANRVIGTQGDLPWSLPEDMKFFRETTKGHVMVMGRKTFDSFHGKALPHRFHIVVTRHPESQKDISSEESPVVFVSSIEQALNLASTLTHQWGSEIFIIGGGEIYKQAMPYTDKIYLTRIHRDFPGDTFYPEIDQKFFRETQRKDVPGEIPFSFLTYEKIRS